MLHITLQGLKSYVAASELDELWEGFLPRWRAQRLVHSDDQGPQSNTTCGD